MRRLIAGICMSAAAIAAAARPAAAATEIVLSASDVAKRHGNWALASDASTAGGSSSTAPTAGQAPTARWPLGHYFSSFRAPAIRHSTYGCGCAARSQITAQCCAVLGRDHRAEQRRLHQDSQRALRQPQSCSSCAVGMGWIDGACRLAQRRQYRLPAPGLTRCIRARGTASVRRSRPQPLDVSVVVANQVMNGAARSSVGGGGGSTPFSGTPSAFRHHQIEGSTTAAGRRLSRRVGRQFGRRAPSPTSTSDAPRAAATTSAGCRQANG